MMSASSERLPGLFVTFEGIDGSGKSTQLQRCAERLESLGYEILITRNPGGTELGQSLRHILLHEANPVAPVCELLLYMADRAQHTEEVVLPALRSGKIVLCDRHGDSTAAYQGYGRGLDLALIEQLNQIATQGYLPQITILLDAPPEQLAERVRGRGKEDRLEREALAFHQRVREGFLTLAQHAPDRIRVFDALLPLATLEDEITQYVLSRWKALQADPTTV